MTFPSVVQFFEPGARTGLEVSISPCAYQLRSASRSMGPISLPSPIRTL
jgi:hypothetical protein